MDSSLKGLHSLSLYTKSTKKIKMHQPLFTQSNNSHSIFPNQTHFNAIFIKVHACNTSNIDIISQKILLIHFFNFKLTLMQYSSNSCLQYNVISKIFPKENPTVYRFTSILKVLILSSTYIILLKYR